jgi:phosphohistidine phosphatase
MDLYLFRHGIAVDRDDPDCPLDPDRPLTGKGERRTRAAARGLRALRVRPDLIVTSPYRRAVQTAEIAAEELGYAESLRYSDDLLPDGDPTALLSSLWTSPAERVLCTGHNPNLTMLIAAATAQPDAFAALRKAGGAFLELGATGGTLRWLLEPKTLRLLGNGA